MCTYCDAYNKSSSTLELGDVFIATPAKYSTVGDGKLHSIPLNYCPNCGRELSTPENLCSAEAYTEVLNRIKKYDEVNPGVVELKFIGDIVDKYCIEHSKAVGVIQYIRRHPEVLK